MEEKLIDCHAHLIFENINPELIIKDMDSDNLCGIISVATNSIDIVNVLDLAVKNEHIFAALGFHPEYANDITKENFDLLIELAKNQKVVAIGECGLDYHYSSENKQKQIEIFEKQIIIAKQLNKPLMVHIRDAEQDALKLLKKYIIDLSTVVIHCYSAVSSSITKEFVDLGVYFSFAGNFTYKNMVTYDEIDMLGR